MEMPAAIVQAVDMVDAGQFSALVEDYGPAIAVVRSTWDKETLAGILEGHIAVPDEVINSVLAEKTAGSEKVRSVKIVSQGDGRLQIDADTVKLGRIELKGTVDEFVHRDGKTYFRYTVKERNLPERGLLSWIFSRVSLSMAQRLVGHVDLGEDLPIQIDHNTVTVDFNALLQQSAFGQVALGGYSLLDALVIEKAEPHDGYVEFTTALNIPEPLKKMLLNLALAAI